MWRSNFFTHFNRHGFWITPLIAIEIEQSRVDRNWSVHLAWLQFGIGYHWQYIPDKAAYDKVVFEGPGITAIQHTGPIIPPRMYRLKLKSGYGYIKLEPGTLDNYMWTENKEEAYAVYEFQIGLLQSKCFEKFSIETEPEEITSDENELPI
jgi:hypothetical protein